MSIDVSWGNEDKTYVYLRVVGEWKWPEYHLSVVQANAHIESVDYPVCIVTHLIDTDAQRLPKQAFSQWQKSMKNTPANLRMVIIVPGKPIIRIFLDTAYKIFSPFITFKFRMAATLEDAQDIVEQTLSSQITA